LNEKSLDFFLCSVLERLGSIPLQVRDLKQRAGKNRKEPESGHISSIFGEIDHILEKLTQNATRGGIGSDRKAKTYKTEI
jgi:hypothetical protein